MGEEGHEIGVHAEDLLGRRLADRQQQRLLHGNVGRGRQQLLALQGSRTRYYYRLSGEGDRSGQHPRCQRHLRCGPFPCGQQQDAAPTLLPDHDAGRQHRLAVALSRDQEPLQRPGQEVGVVHAELHLLHRGPHLSGAYRELSAAQRRGRSHRHDTALSRGQRYARSCPTT